MLFERCLKNAKTNGPPLLSDLISPDRLISATWTKQLLFKAFNRQNGSTFQSVATYNRINFYRQTAYEGDNPRVPKKTEFHHNLFGSIHHSEINQANHSFNLVDLGDQKFIAGDLKDKQYGQIVTQSVVWDDETIVFRSVKKQKFKELDTYLPPFHKYKPYDFRSRVFMNNKHNIFEKKYFQRVIIDEGSDNHVECQSTLGITKSEFSILKQYSGIDTEFEAYITLERILATDGSKKILNSYGIEYSKYSLVVKGYNIDGDYIPAITTIANPVTVYSYDDLNFFSKMFVEKRGITGTNFNPANGLLEENFVFQDNAGLGLQLNQFMQDFMQDLINVYGQSNLTYTDATGNLRTVGVSPACGLQNVSGTIVVTPNNPAFTTVNVIINPGSGVANAANSSLPNITGVINVFAGTPIGTNGDWNMAAGNFNNTVAHEFGHLFGLADRYIDGGIFSVSDASNYTPSNFTRLTIPLRTPLLMTIDSSYNYLDNLYSNSESTLTQYQVNVLFARVAPECPHGAGIAWYRYGTENILQDIGGAFKSDTTIALNDYSQFDGIEVDDEQRQYSFLLDCEILTVEQINGDVVINGITFKGFSTEFKKRIIGYSFGILPFLDDLKDGKKFVSKKKLLKAPRIGGPNAPWADRKFKPTDKRVSIFLFYNNPAPANQRIFPKEQCQ
jgi:hypothetical protein